MTDATPEMVAMAEYIVRHTTHSVGCAALMSDWDRGLFTAGELAEVTACDCDREQRIALAAIIETSEMAAKLAASAAPDHTTAANVSVRLTASAIATALRAYDHIKPENG